MILNQSIQDEIINNNEKLNLYNTLDILARSVCKDDDLAKKTTDCMYAIIDFFDKKGIDGSIIRNFNDIKTIEFYEEDSLIDGFVASNNVKINRFNCDNEEKIIRTLIHELLHMSSKSHFKSHFISGVAINTDLTSINEIFTVKFEDDISKQYFDYNIEKENFIIKLGDSSNINFNISFKGYESISQYSDFIIALEDKKNIIDLYFQFDKFENDDRLYLKNLRDFHKKYSKLDNQLSMFRDFKSKSSTFLKKDCYIKANNEIFSILKNEIDNGLSLEDYTKKTSYLLNNCEVILDEGFFKEDIISKTIELFDIYYLSSNLKNYYNDLNNFLKNEIDNNSLASNLIHNKIQAPYISKKDSINIDLNLFSKFMNEVRDNYKYDKSCIKNSEINIFNNLIKEINKIDNFPKININENIESYSLDYLQLASNYLTLANPINKNQEKLKFILNENKYDLELIEQRVKEESKKYNFSKFIEKFEVYGDIFNKITKNKYVNYDEKFLIDIVTKVSDMDYFKKVLEIMHKENKEWYNDLLNTPHEFICEGTSFEVSPLYYALNNSRPNMFMLMMSFADTNNIKKVYAVDIDNIAKYYSNLNKTIDYSSTIDIITLNKDFCSKGYNTIFDFITLPENVIRNNKTVFFSLMEDYKFRNNKDLEYNLNKLASMGFSIYDKTGELLVNEKKQSIIDLLIENEREDIILNHLDNTKNLNFNLSDEKIKEIINNYIYRDLTKIKELEPKFSSYVDYNKIIKKFILNAENAINIAERKDNLNKVNKIILGQGVIDKLDNIILLSCFEDMMEFQSYEKSLKYINEKMFDRAVKLDTNDNYFALRYCEILSKDFNNDNISKINNIIFEKEVISVSQYFKKIKSNLNHKFKGYNMLESNISNICDSLYKYIKDNDIQYFLDENNKINKRDILLIGLNSFIEYPNIVNDILDKYSPVEIFGNNKSISINNINKLINCIKDNDDYNPVASNFLITRLTEINNNFKDNVFSKECEKDYSIEQEKCYKLINKKSIQISD